MHLQLALPPQVLQVPHQTHQDPAKAVQHFPLPFFPHLPLQEVALPTDPLLLVLLPIGHLLLPLIPNL